MAKFIIEGQQKLKGSIEVLGAKNAAIKMVAASCLINGITVLENVPDILDIQKIMVILKKLGVKFSQTNHKLLIDTTYLKKGNPDPILVGLIRASIILVGPLLARFKKVKISHPGGCTIGRRPIDQHLKAFRALGIKIRENQDYYEFEQDGPLLNNPIVFDKISVGATENILLFASLCEQQTVISNAAIEPEIIDLIEFLKKAGAKIEVNNRRITIIGRHALKAVTHRVIPDRIEAGTFMIMAAVTNNPLKITGVVTDHLESLFEKFNKMGVEFEKRKDFVYIKKSKEIKATDITTAEYPGFPTDLQPPMGVLLTQAKGTSKINEDIFENRLGYLNELKKMGADIKKISNKKAEITGPSILKGAKIHSLDLRAGATLIIAGLTANGITEISQAENIDRGYEKIENRLQNIGAKIKRV